MNLEELKIERIRQKLTQKKLADKMGINEISYNRKERGIRNFSMPEIQALSEILKIDIDKANEIFFNNKLTKDDADK